MTRSLDEFADGRVDDLERQVARLERELHRERGAVAEVKRLKAERAELERLVDLLTDVDHVTAARPGWARRKTSKGGHRATVNLLLSDLHLDEVVDPAQVAGANAYNRHIATLRLRKWCEKSIMLAREYLAGVAYDGVSLDLGGDLVSGTIHDELRETNEAPLPDTIEYWLGPLAECVGTLADEFGAVWVKSVVGNHGRNTRKPRAKGRVRDNVDWLLARLLAREFRADDRVTFTIPDETDCRYDLYGHGYLLTHGDQFRGGSGWGGMFSPIMRGRQRKVERDNALEAMIAAGRSWHTLVMGHWHRYFPGRDIVVNGSLKGLDEYAFVENFAPEVPTQAMWVTSPEHGPTVHVPIFCAAGRRREGW